MRDPVQRDRPSCRPEHVTVLGQAPAGDQRGDAERTAPTSAMSQDRRSGTPVHMEVLMSSNALRGPWMTRKSGARERACPELTPVGAVRAPLESAACAQAGCVGVADGVARSRRSSACKGAVCRHDPVGSGAYACTAPASIAAAAPATSAGFARKSWKACQRPDPAVAPNAAGWRSERSKRRPSRAAIT